MIKAHRLENGTLTTTEGVDAVVAPEGDARTWFHVYAPDTKERQVLVDRLGLHEIGFNNALRERHPPKLEDFGDHLFIITHTPVKAEGRHTRKIAIFLSKRWILTLSVVELDLVKQVEQWVVGEGERFLSEPERVAHALIARQMDGFEGLVDSLVDRVETLECGVSDHAGPECLELIQAFRRENAALIRIVRAQRDVLQSLSRTNHPALTGKITLYLRDVYDHSLRIYDHLDGVRESLAAARDGYLSAVNNRLSETMRVLTVIATIMMPLSLVAGVFGMNFAQMPLLRDGAGFWITMGAMLTIAVGMLAWFRSRDWI